MKPSVLNRRHDRFTYLEAMMKTYRKAVLSTIMIIAILGAAMLEAAAAKEAVFVGMVRDIDFAKARTQIIINGTAPTDQLIASVTEARLQAVLESALISGRSVSVRHLGGIIQSVSLLSTPTTCSAAGCIEELKCSSFCEAKISGHDGPVKTSSQRALGILLTAINNHGVVAELMTDSSGQITRVKVNVP